MALQSHCVQIQYSFFEYIDGVMHYIGVVRHRNGCVKDYNGGAMGNNGDVTACTAIVLINNDEVINGCGGGY